ncbi:hypothetical protein RND81_08G049400 [Saponaria officinalis]|uniref:Alpha/beta-Hydrolases superfamily protein n=1 Tax=Saponaria officinalis TaxID=3572 RepID=A0AAW1J579_SAPOF
MEDMFTRIVDLASYLSSSLRHILDLYFGSFSGHYETCDNNRFGFEDCYESIKDHGGTRREMLGESSNSNQQLLINANVRENYGEMSLLSKGLTIPLFDLRIIRSIALAPWRCFAACIRYAKEQIRSTILCWQKSLCGSSDDIGWLLRTPGMPLVKDGTDRFLELLQTVRDGQHTLPDSFVYLLIPGLLSNHGPLYFVATKRFFSKMGLVCHIAKIHSEASVEHNAWVLKHYIEELYWGCGKRVMLLGHSKGGVDAAAALSKYWKDLRGKVGGLALVQSPYGGTPIASDIVRQGQVADKETRRVMELIICNIIKGDFRSLEDLTYEKRKEFILNHKLPEEIPLISFHSEANIAPGVLTTLTQIAHAELPWLRLPTLWSNSTKDCVRESRRVPIVIPVSAAMALSALHLRLRYGEKSDGLVTCRDAVVPGSVMIRPDKKLDHAWMVYSSWKKNPTEPDSCEMCEAILTLLVELEKTKRTDGGRSVALLEDE